MSMISPKDARAGWLSGRVALTLGEAASKEFGGCLAEKGADRVAAERLMVPRDGLLVVLSDFLNAAAASTADGSGPKVLWFWVQNTNTSDDKAPPTLQYALGAMPEGMLESSALYVVKSDAAAVAQPAADGTIAGLEWASLTGDTLGDMGSLVRDVYVPLLDSAHPALADAAGGAAQEERAAPAVAHWGASEFRASTLKFESQITHAMKQVKGDVQLHVPNVTIDSVDDAADSFELIQQLDAAMEEWSKLIQSVNESESAKRPRGKGPLAEIEFWRQRNAALSALYAQINMPNVQAMIAVQQRAEANMLQSFNYNFGELSKLYVEAKDNVKFLTTLERHFKNISEGSFSTILDTLPSMMNAIRMVWIISRHYNTDERMVPLMERIAAKISEKVETEVNIKTIMRKPPEIAKRSIKEACTVLESWQSIYLSVRQRIEDSGTHIRWEFDRKRLFEQTNYMARVCADLHEVATVLDQFHKFLGPELKAVTGESEGIDDLMLRVEQLIDPLEKLAFNVFDRRYRESWSAVMQRFNAYVIDIEELTKIILEQSFKKLRSAEGAFDLVENFRNIQSRESINTQINERYKDILLQYTKELEVIHQIFDGFKERPPIYKNYPPVAGAIAWARDLYYRAKKPILRFKAHEGLLQSDYGQEVKHKYLLFARAVDTYITHLQKDWQTRVQSVATEKLKQPILMAPRAQAAAAAAAAADAESGHATESAAAGTDAAAPAAKTAALAVNYGAGSKHGSQQAFRMPPPPYRVNFAPELSMIMRESKYLDRMGYPVPEAALNVTLQEDKYHTYMQKLKLKLSDYDSLLASLSVVENQLLAKQLTELQRTLRTGFTPLNWNSQRIPSFIESCDRVLAEFQGIVSQIHKSSTMIEEVVSSIESMVLVTEADIRQVTAGAGGKASGPKDVTELYEIMEEKRMARLEALVSKYKSVGSLLRKVEGLVAATDTGASPALATYYHYWEKRIFNAITRMIVTSMATFLSMVQSKEASPFCIVKVTLQGKDLVNTPLDADLFKYLTKSVKNIVESAKLFSRWMDGTCTEAEPQIISEDEEPYVFSFYQDISQNQHVINLMWRINQSVHDTLKAMGKYLGSWSNIIKDYNLSNPKRKQLLAKVAEKNRSYVYFDNHLSRYEALKDSVMSRPSAKDLEFLRIDCSSVASSIASQATEWKVDYGKVLHSSSLTMMGTIGERMGKLEEDLTSSPQDLEELKFVLNTVSTIISESMDMELSYHNVMERYRTLARYSIDVPEDEAVQAKELANRWHALVVSAKTKDLRLQRVKEQFREVTKQQALDFTTSLEVMKKAFYESGPGKMGLELAEGQELVKEFQIKIGELNRRKQDLVLAEGLFALDQTEYPTLQEIADEQDELLRIYSLFHEYNAYTESMSAMLWAELDIVALQKGAEDLEKKARKFPKGLKEHPAYKKVETVILNFKSSLPMIVNLKNDAMKQRHWKDLQDATGVQFEMNPQTFTLGNIFAMKLHNYTEAIDEIVVSALQELKIENELKSIESTWASTDLATKPYSKDGVVRSVVLMASEETTLLLEDNMLQLQTMSSSRFVVNFADRVRKWEKALNLVAECMDVWFQVQRQWIYLESIFIGAEDIRMQLPEEAKKFDGINKAFKTLMTQTANTPNVVKACTTDNRLELLIQLQERLTKTQKSLTDYLDTKRIAFARFFFISDDELLSVLGSSDPANIQVHMLKLFDNVKALGFSRNKRQIVHMKSSEGEGFDLQTPSPIEGAVEIWMTAAEEEMKASLLQITKEGTFKYAHMERTKWLESVLGMVSLVGSQIWWTWEVEDVFRRVGTGDKYAMKELEAKLTSQLNDLVAMVRKPIERLTRKKVNTMLIIDVHARDIVSGFIRESILHVKEFAWESQLRFYWDRNVDTTIIRQCTGSFQYGFEYMGLNGRLVITPLTDRCYMTITTALTFKLGGSPAGPAGTGKTETVKDLAKSLALPCFVVNCGEGLDYKAMGSIFSGLVQVGAWGCFDEFNRINIEVLSVVSAQLRAIQNALLFDQPFCNIGTGSDIRVKRVAGFATCGFFITMNPGYAGRTELPDNLKALFRPVTMIVPDLQQICEIMLFSEGFEGAKVLAKKMTVLYKLSKEQLSKQYHYDFGLRSLKSVLVMAGGLKREYSHMPEDVVLMRTLRDSSMPKFVYEDVPLFRGLVNDLFPGLDCPRVSNESLKAEIQKHLESNGYKCSDETVFADQVNKVIEMYETQVVRHTTMIVGPTGGGKSLVLDTLKAARLPAENVSVKMFVLNAKAQPLNELYGVMDPVTRDWQDGILSKLFRELNEPLPESRENEVRWIVYDGDVDAVWVENMNSVMDDNRLLTLPNGERIRLQDHVKMICETYDLQYASPATISRCGMVWVDPKNLGFRPYYERWVMKRCGDVTTHEIDPAREDEANLLIMYFDKYIPSGMDYVQSGLIDGEAGEKLRLVIPITEIDMVKQLCSVLDAFLDMNSGPDGAPLSADDVEGIYIFAVIWSLGAALLGPSREKFNAFIKKVSMGVLPDGLLYDSFYDTLTGRWNSWSSKVTDYVEPSPFEFYNIAVPTTDSVLYTSLLEHLVPLKAVLFVGESGTAKTVTIQNYLNSLPAETSSKLNINFSSRTSSHDVQQSIEANVDKRSGSTYGPPVGKRLVVFIDDMNMPKVDTYGTQQPITLLLTLMSRGFIWDRQKDLTQKTLKDVAFVGAMGPPGGGRNNVDPRFIALFNVINLTPPTTGVLKGIYSAIVSTRLENFQPAVKTAAGLVTDATLQLYQHIVDTMPPTPSKFHYIWNLRDLSRVYEGLCLATEDKVTTADQFVRLWRNECQRIFCDRLTTESENEGINAKIGSIIGSTWAESAEFAMKDPCIFGDYAQSIDRIVNEGEDAKLYEDLGGFDRSQKIFDEAMENYNIDNKPMQLVLFQQAIEHITRILRIIKTPRGNALLVGVGGSGKQSLTTLATYTAGYSIFSISLVRGYGENEFLEDLRLLFGIIAEKPCVFLFTDAHVIEEGFLEVINNMLTTGVPAALFDQDEKDAAANGVRKEVKAAGLADTNDTCWDFYVAKCRDNLHLVLAMSPSGDKLRTRCRNFPGLISNAIIDWFFPWPEEALHKVADFFLSEATTIPEEHRSNVVKHLVFAHLGVVDMRQRFEEELRRYYYVTPKNYLDFIANYKSQMQNSGVKIERDTKRLEGGLTKLVEAATAVDRMQIDLSKQKVIVDAKTKEVTALIEEIRGKKEVADKQQTDAEQKEVVATEQAVVIEREKEKADAALMEALPAVEAAAAALENLDKKDLDELKAFAKPPPAVQDVCQMVVVLRPTGEKLDEDWAGAKKMLANGRLLDLLKTYAKEKLTEKMVRGVRKYYKNSALTMENMAKVSKAGLGLFTWVNAIVKYYDVAKDVEPLRARVRDMEKAQGKTEKELAQLRQMLDVLQTQLEKLGADYSVANGELTELQTKASVMEKRLQAANKLITGLTGERSRWTADIEVLKGNKVKLVGDCLMAASFLSYSGAFTRDFRHELIYVKFQEHIAASKIPATSPFKVDALLTTEAIVQGWTAKGLPADEHSVQNGILTTQASRFPLCIDPQQQAVTWIKNTFAKDNLKVKSLNQSDFMKHLELAVQFGNPFLFENIDTELDPMLDPILEKNITIVSGQAVLKIADKTIQWDDNFRLFFTTKLSNPHYSPEVMGKLMLVNYTVTQDGLANQLLNVVVAHERPDLEERFSALVTEMSDNAQMIVTLEDTLLRELASSSGNILDNEELIATLDNTKTQAVSIQGKLEQSRFTRDEISKAREAYTGVAGRGSVLYFAIAGLSGINSMYETSLDSFLVVFNRALDEAKKDVVLDNRLRNMRDAITRNLYEYTCTGIFERHKLMFSFQMTCMIMEAEASEEMPFERSALDFFLKGDTSIEAPGDKNPAEWLSASGWKDLVQLASLADTLDEAKRHFLANTKEWEAWYDLEAPESVPFPGGFSDSLTALQRLCIMRCFRVDRVYTAVKLFVIASVGEKYVQPPVLDYQRIFNQSSPLTPMVFILSPGADPQSDIQILCENEGMMSKFKFMALGQGQGPLAEQMLDQGYSKGNWVLLQNCHLLASWLKMLEKRLEVMKTPHKDFRLWLTTEPTNKFPLGILQRALKVVTEPPDGLRLNMRATYSKIDESVVAECPHEAFQPCLYVLAFLHAVVQERRKYGKIGWNVNYDFNESDFVISRKLLSLYLAKAFEDGDENLPWDSLKYLIGDAMYGGRVSDNMDRRVLVTYLQEYMGEFLFDDHQKFYFSQAGFDYELPDNGPLDNYKNKIEELPLTNSPAVFGLHPNAEISFYSLNAKSMWVDLISLQPRAASTGGGVSREETISSIAGDISKSIPILALDIGTYDLIIVRATIKERNAGAPPTPCQVVLLQEMERWNKLAMKMAVALIDLGRALTGEIGMSDELDLLGDALFNGFLPSMWAKLAPATEKALGSWMSHYTKRHVQYEQWYTTGKEPAVVWLSGLHIPESYLTALVQTTCRARNWPLDKSDLYTVVTQFRDPKEVKEALGSGCYVSGLYLEGASWSTEKECLARQLPKQLVEELPILQVIPVELSKLKLTNVFKTPVYVTQARRNAMGVGLVFAADLSTHEHPSHWVLQSVALCLNVSE